MEPTLRSRWTDIIVDPAGFIWLKPWRPHSHRSTPGRALIVDPATGRVDSLDVNAFPSAFLSHGDMVALTSEERSDVPLIQLFGVR